MRSRLCCALAVPTVHLPDMKRNRFFFVFLFQPDQGMGDTSTVASSSPPSPMLRDRCAPLKCRSAPTGRRRTTMATARSAAPPPSTSGETSPPAMLEQERTSQVDAAQSGSEREIQLHVQEVRQQAKGTRCECVRLFVY